MNLFHEELYITIFTTQVMNYGSLIGGYQYFP